MRPCTSGPYENQQLHRSGCVATLDGLRRGRDVKVVQIRSTRTTLPPETLGNVAEYRRRGPMRLSRVSARRSEGANAWVVR